MGEDSVEDCSERGKGVRGRLGGEGGGARLETSGADRACARLSRGM